MISRSVGTHSGSFHADEILACALLYVFDLIDRDQVFRSRDADVLAKCEYVCDVGGVYDPAIKRFDHHQIAYEGKLSSAGMIWLFLKEQHIVDDALYTFLNEALILGVDAHDNGRSPQLKGICTFSHIISNFLPIEYDPSQEDQDRCFFKAFDFATGHLKRFIARFRYVQSCKEKVKKAMDEGQEFMIFEEPLPWLENFFELGGESHPAKFFIMPSGGHWKLRAIPPTLNRRMEVRMALPEEWAGLLEDDLKQVSKIPGAVFCHKGLFTSVWETKDDALKALEYTLRRN